MRAADVCAAQARQREVGTACAARKGSLAVRHRRVMAIWSLLVWVWHMPALPQFACTVAEVHCGPCLHIAVWVMMMACWHAGVPGRSCAHAWKASWHRPARARAAAQGDQVEDIRDIDRKRLEYVFKTNIIAMCARSRGAWQRFAAWRSVRNVVLYLVLPWSTSLVPAQSGGAGC